MFRIKTNVYNSFPRSYNKCRASAHIPLRTARFSNKNSAVGTARRIRSLTDGLPSSTKVHTGSGAHQASRSMGTRPSPWVKRLGRQVHLQPMNYTPTHPYTTSRRGQGKVIFYFTFLAHSPLRPTPTIPFKITPPAP
jgi:hypothetical protein